jgi:NAD(P)-dependent dehydrogenase (short-subunit alcohol dehydrogenase family)
LHEPPFATLNNARKVSGESRLSQRSMRPAIRERPGYYRRMQASVLVTGASKGLGLCLAQAFASAGLRVFAGFREPAAGLEALVRRFEGRVTPVPLDVTQASSVRNARDEVARHTSVLDILVNNAAILPEAGRGPLERLNVEVGLALFDTNSLGPLRVTQAFLPLLRAGERKLVLNISSEAGSIADCWRKDDHLYCMSKAALNMQCAILKNDLEPDGIEILAVQPGWMRTDMGGPKADIHPQESADGIVALTRTKRSASDPFYVDYQGKPLRW